MRVITQKRVINVGSILTEDMNGQELTIAVKLSDIEKDLLSNAGFEDKIEVGQSVLPSIIGPISRFNAKGKDEPIRTEPKEIRYRDMEFTRHEWHGRERVEVTGVVWIPYKRYPRNSINPPGINFTVGVSPDGTELVIGEKLICSPRNYENLKHQINLFLEYFGHCLILENDENPVLSKVVRLNWHILPPGEYPWDVVNEHLRSRLSKQPPKSLAAALNRFEKVNSLKPNFLGFGRGGYKGYVVFGFQEKKLYVLESQNSNNAIYVFREDWEELSQLTKAEILSGDLHHGRVIHKENWFNELQELLAA